MSTLINRFKPQQLNFGGQNSQINTASFKRQQQDAGSAGASSQAAALGAQRFASQAQQTQSPQALGGVTNSNKINTAQFQRQQLDAGSAGAGSQAAGLQASRFAGVQGANQSQGVNGVGQSNSQFNVNKPMPSVQWGGKLDISA